MARRSKQANFVALNLRLPPDLHKKLVKSAGPTSSLNSEIIRRLQLSYDDAPEWEELKRDILASQETIQRVEEKYDRVTKALNAVEEYIRNRVIPSPSKEE